MGQVNNEVKDFASLKSTGDGLDVLSTHWQRLNEINIDNLSPFAYSVMKELACVKKIIAVTGPSGAGKTTITSKMFKDYGFAISRHTTTREPRCDDATGFYRYITLEQFDVYLKDNKFLIASGDNVRGYGILKSDCEDAWCFSDTIIINVSYKDVYQLTSLPYKVKIVVLTFKDIIQGVIGYKAKLAGISVEYVNPAYTSQTCPICGSVRHANDRNYACECGFRIHRDLLGAMNICNSTEFVGNRQTA